MTMLGRPDIELAKEVSKLTSQVRAKGKVGETSKQREKRDIKLTYNVTVIAEIIARVGEKGKEGKVLK